VSLFTRLSHAHQRQLDLLTNTTLIITIRLSLVNVPSVKLLQENKVLIVI